MMSGMRFGRRAGETLDRALELAPGDPRALYLKGVSQLMAPGPFGNREEARENLAAAVARFAEGAPDGAFWWGEAEAHAFLGLSYAREKKRRPGSRGLRAGAGTGAGIRLGPRAPPPGPGEPVAHRLGTPASAGTAGRRPADVVPPFAVMDREPSVIG